VDPESALKTANRKFRRRFRHVEDRLAAQGLSPAESTLDEMDALWDEAKREERARGVSVAHHPTPEATSDPNE
jgi:uncharacterized protein YabN with tetrapyrrole methylase and pyrophosphatase domain